MGNKIEMVGKVFGRLTVIEESSTKKGSAAWWICRCECGKTTNPIRGVVLRKGLTKSCGCLFSDKLKERNTTHGLYYTRLHKTWDNMKQRCNNEKNPAYKHYGGRGISVCKEWQNSFETFFTWAINNGYAENLTIDRVDPNGNYEPSNCQWLTIEDQQRKRRNAILVDVEGDKKTVAQVARENNLSTTKVYRDLKKRRQK